MHAPWRGPLCLQAGYVADAWERRWGGAPEAARPPRPRFIHSNLASYDEIIALAR